MGIEKIGKKLPEDIISIIDAEAAVHSISRQEAVSRLIHSVSETRYESENELLKNQLKDLTRQISMKDDEITYLRGELSALNRGLTKLAENLMNNNSHEDEIVALVSPIKAEISQYSDELKKLQEEMKNNDLCWYDKHTPLIIIGILAALLIVYLIVSTMVK